jgi:hypothetical protein
MVSFLAGVFSGSGVQGAEEDLSTTGFGAESEREVPTGPDPIHHHARGPRRQSPWSCARDTAAEDPRFLEVVVLISRAWTGFHDDHALSLLLTVIDLWCTFGSNSIVVVGEAASTYQLSKPCFGMPIREREYKAIHNKGVQWIPCMSCSFPRNIVNLSCCWFILWLMFSLWLLAGLIYKCSACFQTSLHCCLIVQVQILFEEVFKFRLWDGKQELCFFPIPGRKRLCSIRCFAKERSTQ